MNSPVEEEKLSLTPPPLSKFLSRFSPVKFCAVYQLLLNVQLDSEYLVFLFLSSLNSSQVKLLFCP